MMDSDSFIRTLKDRSRHPRPLSLLQNVVLGYGSLYCQGTSTLFHDYTLEPLRSRGHLPYNLCPDADTMARLGM